MPVPMKAFSSVSPNDIMLGELSCPSGENSHLPGGSEAQPVTHNPAPVLKVFRQWWDNNCASHFTGPRKAETWTQMNNIEINQSSQSQAQRLTEAEEAGWEYHLSVSSPARVLEWSSWPVTTSTFRLHARNPPGQASWPLLIHFKAAEMLARDRSQALADPSGLRKAQMPDEHWYWEERAQGTC